MQTLAMTTNLAIYLADGEMTVCVNERTGTSSGTSSTSVSILDRLGAPTAPELGHYNQSIYLDTWNYVA